MTQSELITKLQSYVYTNGIGLVTGIKMQEILIDIVTYAFHTDNFANDVRSVVVQDSMDGNSTVMAPSVSAIKNYLLADFLVNNLTTADEEKALSAQQGYELKTLIDNLESDFSTLLIDDLVTAVTDKALTANQGVVIKALLDDLEANKVTQAEIDVAVNSLKDGVPSTGDTLDKLYNLIISSLSEVTVADNAARDAYDVTSLPTNIFVLDDGDGKWALYKATSTGVGATFVKLSDPDLLNAVMSASQIKASYESNTDTNAFTDALKALLDSVTPLRIMGRMSAGTGNQEQLTGTQVTSILDVFSPTLQGLVPVSGGGTVNFLRADGLWKQPTKEAFDAAPEMTASFGGDHIFFLRNSIDNSLMKIKRSNLVLYFFQPRPVGRSYSGVSLANNTSRTPSSSSDINVLMSVNLVHGASQSAQCVFEVGTGGSWVTVATVQSSSAALGAAINKTIPVNFKVPVGHDYRYVTSGSGTVTIVNHNELNEW